jgi:hypothetical protein
MVALNCLHLPDASRVVAGKIHRHYRSYAKSPWLGCVDQLAFLCFATIRLRECPQARHVGEVGPTRPGGCSWRKMTSRLRPLSAATAGCGAPRSAAPQPPSRDADGKSPRRSPTARMPGAASIIGIGGSLRWSAGSARRHEDRAAPRQPPRSLLTMLPPLAQTTSTTPISEPPATTPDATGKVKSSASFGFRFSRRSATKAPRKNKSP